MSAVHIMSVATAIVLLGAVASMLRRRQLREKYAISWLIAGVGIIVLVTFPNLVNRAGKSLHVIDPVNLLLFAAVSLLMLVCLHLSWEASRLEEETRVLAEELALLRWHVERGQK